MLARGTHLAVLEQAIKHRAVSLAGKTHVEAAQLRHILLHVVGANVFYEVDVICVKGIQQTDLSSEVHDIRRALVTVVIHFLCCGDKAHQHI
jgi:hypothetical protein